MPIKEVAVNWQEIEGLFDPNLLSLHTTPLVCLIGSKMVPFFSWVEMGRDLLFIRARYTFSIWSINSRVQKHRK